MMSLTKLIFILITILLALEIGIPYVNEAYNTSFKIPSDYLSGYLSDKGIFLSYKPTITSTDVLFEEYDTLNEFTLKYTTPYSYLYSSNTGIHHFSKELGQHGEHYHMSYSGIVTFNVTIPRPLYGEYYISAATYRISTYNFLQYSSEHSKMSGFNIYKEYINGNSTFTFMAEPSYLQIVTGIGSKDYGIQYMTGIFRDYVWAGQGFYGEWFDTGDNLNNYFTTVHQNYITRIQILDGGANVIQEEVFMTQWYVISYQ